MEKAVFIRKAVDLGDLRYQMEKHSKNLSEYMVEKTIELEQMEWELFTQDFFAYQDFICENLEFMYCQNGVYHCLQVTCKGKNTKILIESEGYEYAKYISEI